MEQSTQPNEGKCIECGGIYTDVFFESTGKGGRYTSLRRRRRCNGCLQERRDKLKSDYHERVLKKADSTHRHHATKFIRRGIIKNRQELTDNFRWKRQQMAHDIEHAAQNGCGYCNRSFASMANGLQSVTLDIINRNDPPYYGVNTKWICETCNREKAKTPPHRWAEKMVMWERWRERKKQLDKDPYMDTMFEGQLKAANPLLSRITVRSGVRGGQLIVRLANVTVKEVMERLAAGATAEQIVAAYPYLQMDDIKAVYAYLVDRLDREGN